MSKRVIAVVGPTAVGKTAAGIEIARRFRGEIISGDSMQIYKGLDIGTAKATVQEQQMIPHHLIDLLVPGESFSAADFQKQAEELIHTITNKNKIPVIVGGTGFYIRSLTGNLTFHNTAADITFRIELEKYAAEYGAKALHTKLELVDPVSAESIHPNNVKKVIRALEINHYSGSHKRTFAHQEKNAPNNDITLIGLTMERELLYNRINERVDKMIKAGVVEEARWLFENISPQSQAAQAIGYKEFFPYFTGDISLNDAVDLLKRNSRRYAKRQLTWFRNKEQVEWFDVTKKDFRKIITEIIQYLEGKKFLSSNT
ncbi:tRNA (adenosine(37)-N6)-dimethylallyltransferase MiaA [Alteribacillus sp. HJP-4]|uniref:tRNA (adenosine(37)-N6)-dimethylallyltransferase MiaA n=1 Tax=Alteribacillus sp. HJP-4 TaxID=2775394 RepID=UPI0035CCC870